MNNVEAYNKLCEFLECFSSRDFPDSPTELKEQQKAINYLKDRAINTTCCKQEMVYLDEVDFCNMNINHINKYVCLKCGRIISIIDEALDTENLQNLKDNYPEQFKNLEVV